MLHHDWKLNRQSMLANTTGTKALAFTVKPELPFLERDPWTISSWQQQDKFKVQALAAMLKAKLPFQRATLRSDVSSYVHNPNAKEHQIYHTIPSTHESKNPICKVCRLEQSSLHA